MGQKGKYIHNPRILEPSKLRYANFLALYYRRQNWPFRENLIHYILLNPSTSKCYQKLIQSCKYFFVQNPIIVIQDLNFNNKKQWVTCSNSIYYSIDLKHVLSNFWISSSFIISCSGSTRNLVSSIMHKLYKVEVKELYLRDQSISYDEFTILTSNNVKEITLWYTTVRNKDDAIVQLEKLVKILPKIKNIEIYDIQSTSCIKSNTVDELLKLPHFSTIDKFEMFYIPEAFDIDAFFSYIKKNQLTKFRLYFNDSISEAYKNLLESIIDEIIEIKDHDFKTPYIYFDGSDNEKRKKLLSLFDQN